MRLSKLTTTILFVLFLACQLEVVSQDSKRVTVSGQVETIGHVSGTGDDVIHYSLHVRDKEILFVGHITPAKAISFLGKRIKSYGELNYLVGKQVIMTLVTNSSGVSGRDNYVTGPVVRLTVSTPHSAKENFDTKPAATVKRFIRALDAGNTAEAIAQCSEKLSNYQDSKEETFGKLSHAIRERQGVKLIEILEEGLITTKGNPFYQIVARVTYRDRNIAFARFRVIKQGSAYVVSFWDSGMRPGATIRFPT